MKKRKKRMTTNILIILGLLCLAYFVIYMALVDLTNVFTYFWLLAGIGCFVLCMIYKKVVNGQIVIPQWIKWTFGLLFMVAFVMILVAEIIIIQYGNEKPDNQADYVLVLGAQVKGSVPSYALQKRLDVAYDYLVQNPNTKVILSGGKGPGEDVTEAYAMSVYLQALGIENDRMILEQKSTNTDENIQFSRELMKDSNGKIVLVTSHFHVYRGIGVAKKQGLINVEGLGAPTKWYTIPNQYLREAFAVIKYKICGQI